MHEEKKLKEAFSKIKKDIFSLQSQILAISREINQFKRTFAQTDKPTDRQIITENPLKKQTNQQTDTPMNSTDSISKQTNITKISAYSPLKSPNFNVSTGNEGVPTDRQTNQQTDTPLQKFAQSKTKDTDKISQIAKVSEIVNSLDTLKKDIRGMFKKLTSQEMFIYSTIYQLSEQGLIVDYPLLATKTLLSESSVRDYILKLQKKGIPLDKSKENNKKIILSIPADFKKIATLSTIISLRKL